jgi:AraC family transcriptional regulator of arabinose operon
MPLQTYNFRPTSSAPPQRAEAVRPVLRHLVMGHFQEGRGYATWRAHGTTDWLLIATLGGSGCFGFAGGEARTSPGELVLLPPGALHDYGVATPSGSWELLWAHFHPHPHWLEWLDWPQIAPGLVHLTLEDASLQAEIIAKLGEALRHTTGAHRRREEFAMNALETALLLCDTVNPRQGQPVIDGRVRAAMDYLCQNYTHNLSLDQLGAVVGLSGSRLGHLFRKQVGLTPVQFLERQRLERACQLLEFSARPIHSIAEELGFENPFYFTLRFKRGIGQSPRDYRKSRTTSPPPVVPAGIDVPPCTVPSTELSSPQPPIHS